MLREFRIIKGAQLRAKAEGFGISGVAAPFNSVSEDLGGFREIIRPGAFTRDLGTNPDVRGLFNHDPNIVLGRTKSGTLKLWESEAGLEFDCDLPDTQAARDLHVSATRGDIDQCSFAFSTRQDSWAGTWTDDAGNKWVLRELQDVDLYDVSPVTYPAYPDSSFSSRSKFPATMPQEIRALLESREQKPDRVIPVADQNSLRSQANTLAASILGKLTQ